MSPEFIGFIGIIILLIMIFLRIWVGVALSLVGFLGYGLIGGWKNALMVAGSEPFLQISAYSITCIPLFILMGALISNSGIGADLYNTASKWVGNLRGGLAMATVMACGGFSAVSGSSLATGLTMAKIAHPEMKRYRYDSRLAVGSIAVGGTLGSLIPPSLGLIL